MYSKAIRILSKGYLPISLLPPSKVNMILQEVKVALWTANRDYDLVIKRLYLYYDMKLVTFGIDDQRNRITKSRAWDDVYAKLGTEEGEEKIFRIAKAHDKVTKDLTQIKQMKDQEGSVLTDENQIRERWKVYFETFLNEENPRMVTGDGTPNQGMTTEVTGTEVEKALRKMKNGKSLGPDEIPVEAWKCLGREGIDRLTELMQKIWREERMSEDWRNSVITPIYKEKGDIQDCGNYLGIKLMSHTMKIWEKIIDGWIRNKMCIGAEQFGFMPGRSIMDAVFSLRVIMEKYREGQKGLHMVFIDLEKAYDWVP